MVDMALQSKNVDTTFLALGKSKLFKPFLNTGNIEYFPSVFGAKYKVVVY